MNVAVHPGHGTATVFVVIGDNYLIEDNGPGECLHETPKRVFELT
jgi:hypothetical protein